jgi:hypothetical protein
LQPMNVFLVVFPFCLSLLIVCVRMWRRLVDRRFAVGESNERTSLTLGVD